MKTRPTSTPVESRTGPTNPWKERPDAVIHFAEQRAAPYSMKSDRHKNYTVNNNVTATHNLLNALVETVEDLAALVAPDAIDDRLRARLDEARRYKVVDAIVNVDFQDPAVTLVPAAQAAADDKDGMRDFSPDTVHRRRRDGFRFAEDVLRPAFENLWRTPEEGRAVIGSRKIAAGRPKPARRAQRSALDDKEPS